MREIILKFTTIGGITATILGIIGVVLCCSVIPILIFGAGIAAVIIENGPLILGIGMGMIFCSVLTFFFGDSVCRIRK
ncbi:MAG: hypothetical protein A7316_01020 [Candidatus Altiarchaeales archaeon WOR_SM1_86-2]|nr:MAG: hypothetical protein A7316_01020 [Candidatus Altiarchaeales archaeon WOR_SM1_86-2]